MASVHHTFSSNIADDASAQAAGMVLPSHWNQGHTLSGVAEQTSLDALSHALSVLSNQNSVEHAALSVRIDLGGGTASVTSNEVSAVSAQAASALSQALSVLSVTDAALSVRVDTQSQSISVLSQQLSLLSQAHSALSQAHSVLSNVVSNEISNRISADNVVSNNASANAVSIGNVVSNNASVNDASIWSAVSVLRSAISVRSVGDVSTRGMQSGLNALSSRISHAQSIVSALSQQNSVEHAAMSVNIASIASTASALKSAVSNVSATSAGGGSATGLQAVVDALSNKISTIAAGAQSVTSAEYTSTLSDVSHLRSIVSNVSAQSAGGSATGLQNVINMLSNKISQAGGGAGSVTSTELSAALAVSVRAFSAAGSATTSVKGLQSALNQISNNFSNAFSAGSVISSQVTSINNVISQRAPWPMAKHVIISNTQSTTASALTDISGLVLTVAADETWEVTGTVLIQQSATNTGLRMGFSVPVLSSPRFATFDGVSAGFATSAAGHGAGAQLQVSGNSIILSLTSTPTAATPIPVRFQAFFNVASGGTFRVMAAGVNSTAQSSLNILGGYMRAFRLK